MLGVSPLSTGTLSSSSSFILTCQVPSITLKTPIPSIGIATVPRIDIIGMDYQISSSVSVTSKCPEVSLSFIYSLAVVSTGVNAIGTIKAVTLEIPSGTFTLADNESSIPNNLLLQSVLPAYVELFKIDCSSIGVVGNIFLVTPNLAADGVSKIIFGGETYDPYPIQLTGFSQSSDGAFPRPRLDVSNIYGDSITGSNLFNIIVSLYEDLIGSEVTYIRTFSSYLNIASTISAPPLKFYIAKKLNHDKTGISFELRSALDKERAFLPARQMLKRDFPGLGINKSIR